MVDEPAVGEVASGEVRPWRDVPRIGWPWAVCVGGEHLRGGRNVGALLTGVRFDTDGSKKKRVAGRHFAFSLPAHTS